MTNEPKSDPFEALLLAQAEICHAELQNSLKTLRQFEEIRPGRELFERTSAMTGDLLVQHVNQMIDSTTRLANAAARLRGQVIHVARPASNAKAKGGSQKPRFNSETILREGE
jgi:hypothetical protein